MAASPNVIISHIAQWETHYVEPVVFGTTDPHQIAELINNFCHQELGAFIADYLFYESSIGAVCGVRLQDGRRVVVKIHRPSRSLDFLKAIVQVQYYLIEHEYPCTRPVIDPRPLAYGIAIVEEFDDEGEYHQASDPAIRRSMAEMLARLIKLTSKLAYMPALQPEAPDSRLQPGSIWPKPHSELFDFEATAAGAAWIDEIARPAQAVKLHGAGQLVLGHTDWGVKHFRYIGNKVHVIYDWDSLAYGKEPIIVGSAAMYFTYTEFFGKYRLPTAEESHAFIAEYEVARGKPFTPEEKQTMEAAKIYGIAYGARCEHSLHPDETNFPEGSCRATLKQYM